MKSLARWQIRLLGLLQLVVTGLLFAGVLHWLYGTSQQHPARPLPGSHLAAVGFAIPGALTLMSLLQLITGLRDSELQDRWNGYDKVIRTFIAALMLIFFVIILVVGTQYYYEPQLAP